VRRRRRPSEAGFTLVEVLVTVAILGVISFALTESIILGLRTTDDTAGRISAAATVHALSSYFTRDTQSAEEVSVTDSDCAPADPGVFLHLRWTELGAVGGGTTRVSYALDPPAGREQDVIRWMCTAGSTGPDRRVLGHLSHLGAAAALSASCDGAPCPTEPGVPARVTLSVNAEPAAPPTVLTVRRRTA